MLASIAKCEGTLTSVPTDGGSERTRQQEDEKTDSTTFSFSQDIKRMLLSMHNFFRYLRAPKQRSESRLPSDSLGGNENWNCATAEEKGLNPINQIYRASDCNLGRLFSPSCVPHSNSLNCY